MLVDPACKVGGFAAVPKMLPKVFAANTSHVSPTDKVKLILVTPSTSATVNWFAVLAVTRKNRPILDAVTEFFTRTNLGAEATANCPATHAAPVSVNWLGLSIDATDETKSGEL